MHGAMKTSIPTLRQQLSGIVSAAFEACGYDPALGGVTVSNRPDLCQFQCNGALAAAKQYRKNPAMIAKEVVESLAGDARFEKVEFAPPGFINMTLSDAFLAECIRDIAGDERFLLPFAEKPETIVVDYGGPNVAKPLHIGHLRTAIIGESIKRLSRFLGHTVVGDVHLGDWGLQMGLIIAELRDRQPDLVYFDESYTGEYPAEPPVSIDDLNSLYPDASKRSKEDEEFKKVAQQATNELQNGRRGFVALWRHFLDVSVSDLKKSYARLNVDFDEWLGESDAAPYVEDMLKDMAERGLTYLSDGALIMDVATEEDDEPMPPIIISKTDGSQLYGTTDLATIVQRVRDFNPDRMWYVVDNRQAMHFKQVFRAARKAGLVGEDVEMLHVGFGTMNGSDGKPFKTRDGGVMRLSDLIELVHSGARKKMQESETSAEMTEAEAVAIAEQVGIAALKFGDLINHRTKDYVFDLDRFLSSEGKTGPYLQYSVVRITSMLKKAEDAGIKLGEIAAPASETERAMMLKLLSVGDTMLHAFDGQAPNHLCEALFDIAGLFNRFYYENKILACEDEKQRASWLSLMKLTRDMLALLLDLLATDVPEKM